MKKLFLLSFLMIFLLASCSKEPLDVTLNEDRTLTVDGATFYPIENSSRFTDLGTTKNEGAVLGGTVYEVDGGEGIYLLQTERLNTYYVSEEYRGFDKLLEECTEFFYAPLTELDENGKLEKSFLKKADILRYEDALDFAFYVFYGRTPSDYGLENGSLVGYVYGGFPEFESLLSAYPVYEYDSISYGILIDGEEYLLEEDIVRMIGITK